MNRFQILNFIVHSSEIGPLLPEGGMMWWDSTNKLLQVHDDTGWFRLVEGPQVSIDNSIPIWDGIDGKKLKEGYTVLTSVSALGDATALVTDEGIHEAINNAIALGMSYKGNYDASTNIPDLDVSPLNIKKGDTYNITANGLFFTTPVKEGDVIIAKIDNPITINDWMILNRSWNETFLKLTDTPSTYVAQGLKVLRVNAGETGVEFTSIGNVLKNLSATTNKGIGIFTYNGSVAKSIGLDFGNLTFESVLGINDSFIFNDQVNGIRKITYGDLINAFNTDLTIPTPVDDILHWNVNKYTPWSNANASEGRFYNFETTVPSSVKALAYDGNFYVSKSYITSEQTIGSATDFLHLGTHFIEMFSSSSPTLFMNPNIGDVPAAISYIFDTANELTQSGAKLLSIQNYGSEKFAINASGWVSIEGSYFVRKSDGGSSAGSTLWNIPGQITLNSNSTTTPTLYINTGGNAVGLQIHHRSRNSLDNSGDALYIVRSATYASNISGNLIRLVDTGSVDSTGTISGKVLTVFLGDSGTTATTERIFFDPRVSDISNAVAYMLDSHTNLTATNTKILSLRNKGVEKFYITKDGDAYANGILLGAGEKYTNAVAMPEKVGGWNINSTFTDKTMTEMWNGLLYPYQKPAFTSFAISSQATIIEVGDSIAANKIFTWGVSNSGNINAGSIVIRDLTGSVNIATGLSHGDSPYTSTYAAIKKTSATSNTFSITGTNTESVSFSSAFGVTWRWRFRYGESASPVLTEADILTLRVHLLPSSFLGSCYFIAIPSQYKYICYASVLGTATNFKDLDTGMDIPMQPVYAVSVTNVFGVTTNYNVHRTVNMMAAAVPISVS